MVAPLVFDIIVESQYRRSWLLAEYPYLHLARNFAVGRPDPYGRSDLWVLSSQMGHASPGRSRPGAGRVLRAQELNKSFSVLLTRVTSTRNCMLQARRGRLALHPGRAP